MAAARIAPVWALTAMSAAFFFSPDRADSAARCTAGSMVVATAVPACPGRVASVATWAPLAVTTETVVVGVPASWRSLAASSPVWPTTLCTL